MKALIKVGYGCNDHCTFCHTLDVRHLDDTAAAVDRKIDRAAELGHTMVVLSGGEPTIRPELYRWAGRTVRLGLDFGLVTNGRLLSYPEVAERLLGLRLKYAYISLHGGTAKVHNAVVRSHAFEESFGAFRNLTGRGVDLTANCVVTKVNLPHLRALVDLLLPYPDVTVKFSMVEAKGGGAKLFDSIVPRVAEVAAGVRDALAYGAERAGPEGAHRFTHGGIPLCLMQGYEDRFDDLRTDGFATMTEVWEPDFFPVDDLNKTQPPPCRDCGLRAACPGLFTGYLERHGHGELKPTPGLRSNSFNYVPTRRLTWLVGTPCPVRRDGVTPYDRGRSVFVREGETMVLYETRTRDFADPEIDEVKRRQGQVYLDVSDKPAPDDFARDLKKLARVDTCNTCPVETLCAGCYHALPDDVFRRDDALLRERLEALTGDVLDLGCGDGRYADVLAEAVAAGRVRYHGVDPDAAVLAAVAARLPGARTSCARAEDLALAPASYDHVLLLQSYDHLVEPDQVIPRLVKALRPGGTLLVADNVAFGLLRSPGQAARAEAGPARFEHHRNHDAGAAEPLFAGHPLTLLARRDVGPGTSNQWFLHYRRQEEAAC